VILDFGQGWSWEDGSIDSAGDFNNDGNIDVLFKTLKEFSNK